MSVKNYEITKEVYLIREDSTNFSLNSYLIDISSKNKIYKILIDPLPYKYYEEFIKILKESWKKDDIKFIFISHEESGILSSIPEILKIFPDVTIIASKDMCKYLNIYGIKEEQFHPIEFIPNKKIKLESNEMYFFHIPFCTSSSSYILYYRDKNILFTGNFLSGFIVRKDGEIFASESSILGIKMFHEYHISNSSVLKNALNIFGMLENIPEITFPHHGYLIRKNLLEKIFKELNDLKVGLEYIKDMELTGEKYLLALNEFLKEVEKELGHKYVLSKLQKLNVSSSLYMELFNIEGGIITEVRINPSTAFDLITKKVEEDLEPDKRRLWENKIKDILEKYGLEREEKIEEKDWFMARFEKFLETFSQLHKL
ncbi:MAG: MBL fold metallo-hydrolase [Dictyoglomus sp.]|nr:MBL fold metallo-hydrolase [Dictyoglomus sp.]MDW8188311.1 MBL fold metallo-hydrolase [Dictyoglomus sp.]